MADKIGHGIVLQRSDDGTSGGTFAAVGTIRDLTFPNMSRDTVDITDYSATDKWRKYIAGLRDGGELSVDILFDAATGSDVYDMFADFNSDSAGYYKILNNDSGATAWGFAAIITSLSFSTPLDAEMTATAVFKLNGKPTFITLT